LSSWPCGAPRSSSWPLVPPSHRGSRIMAMWCPPACRRGPVVLLARPRGRGCLLARPCGHVVHPWSSSCGTSSWHVVPCSPWWRLVLPRSSSCWPVRPLVPSRPLRCASRSSWLCGAPSRLSLWPCGAPPLVVVKLVPPARPRRHGCLPLVLEAVGAYVLGVPSTPQPLPVLPLCIARSSASSTLAYSSFRQSR